MPGIFSCILGQAIPGCGFIAGCFAKLLEGGLASVYNRIMHFTRCFVVNLEFGKYNIVKDFVGAASALGEFMEKGTEAVRNT